VSTVNAAFDLRSLPTQPGGRSSPEIAGISSLIVIEAVVFIGMIASYFHLRLQNAEWPPPGVEEPELLLASLNTVLLVLTAVPAVISVRALRGGRAGPARIALPIGVAMLVAFGAIKVYEYWDKAHLALEHAYGSMILLMTGLHLVHVTAVVLKTGVVWVYLRQRRIEPRRAAPLQANALYWYFVILVWLPLYATIYLSPRVLP